MATKMADTQMEIVRKEKIPIFETPYRCIRAVNAMVKYHEFRDKWLKAREAESLRSVAKPVVKPADVPSSLLAIASSSAAQREDGRHVLTELETYPILKAYGISTPKGRLARDEAEALAIAREIGYPAVAKIESPDILHRSDARAIHLGIQTPDELKKAFAQIMENSKRYNPKARLRGVSVLEMLQGGGVECIVGTLRDADFGWTVLFGLGGVFVEVLRDVSMRVVPLKEFDAHAMIKEIKGYEILKGTRGREEADIPALVDLLLKVSRLLEEIGDQLAEFEINPLIVLPKGRGAIAADCLMVLK
jgi:acetyltransferase